MAFISSANGLLASEQATKEPATTRPPQPPAANGIDQAASSKLANGGASLATAVGAVDGMPLIDGRSRSRIIDSIYFVGLDQFRSTLSIGPIHGYRGYDVGAEIASELYGAPPNARRFPSLPDDGEARSSPVSPTHALNVLGMGMALGVAGSFLSSALRHRPPPSPAIKRTLRIFGELRARHGQGVHSP